MSVPNGYYTPTGNPATQAPGQSLPIRNEFAAIQLGFGFLPDLLIADKGKIVRLNKTTGGSLESTSAPDVDTQPAQTNSTLAASTGYVDRGLALIEVAAPSGVATYTKTGLSGVYDGWMLVFDLLPVTDGVSLNLGLFDNTNVIINAAGSYYSGITLTSSSATTTAGGANGAASLGLTGSNVKNDATFGGVQGVITISGLQSARLKKGEATASHFTAAPGGAGAFTKVTAGFAVNNSTALGGLQLSFSSGNISSGTVRLYGMR